MQADLDMVSCVCKKRLHMRCLMTPCALVFRLDLLKNIGALAAQIVAPEEAIVEFLTPTNPLTLDGLKSTYDFAKEIQDGEEDPDVTVANHVVDATPFIGPIKSIITNSKNLASVSHPCEQLAPRRAAGAEPMQNRI